MDLLFLFRSASFFQLVKMLASGRGVSSNLRDPRFESIHQQTLLTVICIEKMKIKGEKEVVNVFKNS